MLLHDHFIPWSTNSYAFPTCVPGHSEKPEPTPNIDVLYLIWKALWRGRVSVGPVRFRDGCQTHYGSHLGVHDGGCAKGYTPPGESETGVSISK